MEPLATRYPIGDSVTMASHFLYGISFPFASTSTHPNHGCTLCSDGLIPGGLVFDYVMEVWDPPDNINLGMMCSARVTSRSHCIEFTSLGMEGFGKTTISVGSPMYKRISAVLKYVECLHRITAQLPLEETDGANPDAAEDTGRPSTSSNHASHSHGQRGAPHQVVSRLDPPPSSHASPAPEFPSRTAHAVPDLEISLPTAHASSHPEIPSHTQCTFFDPAHFSFTPPSFDLGYDFSQTLPVMHTQFPLYSIGHIDHVLTHSHSMSFMLTPGLHIDPMTTGLTHISPATPSSPAVVGSSIVGSQAKQPDVHVKNEHVVIGLQSPPQGRPKRTTKAPPCGTSGHKARHKAGPTQRKEPHQGDAVPPSPHTKHYRRQHKRKMH